MIDLKRLRENAGLSQYQLADISGVKREQIARIEAGANTTIQTLEKLLKPLGLEVTTRKKRG